jgi:UPF0755 protein
MTDHHDDVAVDPSSPGRRRGRLVSALLFVVIVVVSLVGGSLYYLHWNFTRAGPLETAQDIVVPRGAGIGRIGTVLAERGVVEEPDLFVVATRLFAGSEPLRAGEFSFAAHISARDAVRVLQSADPVVRRLTVPEGLTSAEIRALVNAADGLDGETPEAAEGSLLPETYHFHWGDSRADLIARMQAGMDAALAELWVGRAEGLPFSAQQDAVILASIVEKETALPAERARVAAVFVNRLKRGMKLQSDPTVTFALTGGSGPLDRALLRSDLTVDHPYNTYVIAGLPPGPIANPGRASLAATLSPADSRDLYFVADGNGGHAFARTLAEHNRNVALWRKLQRQQRRSGTD